MAVISFAAAEAAGTPITGASLNAQVVQYDAATGKPTLGDGTVLIGLIPNPGVPAGTLIDFAGTTAPSGYLACPTTATNISRTTYAALFAAIGTTWGAGDGSTTFGMPWFPSDYASVQANANVGSSSVGQNLAHTHTGGVASSGYTVAPGSSGYGMIGGNTGSSGGAANLAAGVRVLKCVKI